MVLDQNALEEITILQGGKVSQPASGHGMAAWHPRVLAAISARWKCERRIPKIFEGDIPPVFEAGRR